MKKLLAITPRHARLAVTLAGAFAACSFPIPAVADKVTVFAAASLKEALEDVAVGFEEQSNHSLTLSLAGSSVLSRQIAQGAPADIFISANPEWMDVLEAESLIAPETRRDLLGNSLVLVSAEANREAVSISPDTDVLSLLGGGLLAMALVDAVPAGIYGKAALQKLGLWDDVKERVVQTDNVRAALALVALGEAALGVVYTTDALAAPDVRVIGTFPGDAHPPVVYPVAAVTGSSGEAPDQFLSYLRSAEARAAFERWGFSVFGD